MQTDNKRLLFAIACVIGIIMSLVALAGLAFGQESDRTVHVPSPLAGENEKKVVLTAPGPGENLVVVVDLPAKSDHKVIRLPTRITEVRQESGLRLRGGVSAGITFPGHASSSFTGGLIGEIGKADSLWRLQGAFGAGNCFEYRDRGVALNSGLAVMASITSHFRTGVGADLLYCSDVSGHPKEKVSERVVGGSLRYELEHNHFVVAGSIGMGAATKPTPGDRETQGVLYGGVNLSYLWGR